jgi:Cu/Ag efflux pump CusA
MSIAVIGGLITSTVLSLLVIPVVYSLLEGLRMGVSTRWRKWRGMA